MSRSANTEALAQIQNFVKKYMEILGISDAAVPQIAIRDNLGSPWLGRNTFNITKMNSIIEIQKSIVHHPRALERIVAHEVIHHRDCLNITPAEIQLLKMGIRPSGHGKNFLEGAAKINAVMGKDFVTTTSDDAHEQVNTREFFLLIVPYNKQTDRFGYAWASKISPQAREWLDRRIADGGRLFKSADLEWTNGAKIKRFGPISYPSNPNSEKAKELAQIYATGTRINVPDTTTPRHSDA